MKTLPVPSAAPKLNRRIGFYTASYLQVPMRDSLIWNRTSDACRWLFDEGVRTIINLMETHEKNNNRQPFTPYEKQFQEIARVPGVSYLCTFPNR